MVNQCIRSDILKILMHMFSFLLELYCEIYTHSYTKLSKYVYYIFFGTCVLYLMCVISIFFFFCTLYHIIVNQCYIRRLGIFLLQTHATRVKVYQATDGLVTRAGGLGFRAGGLELKLLGPSPAHGKVGLG